MKRNRWTKGHKPRQHISLMDRINPDAAGIDCGSAEHFVAVPVGRDPNPVQSFRTFTGDLHRLADWLAACGVRSVAMEATSVYWIALFDILEARGFEVIVTNAHHVKNVPGRKSEVQDCEWIRELHSVGLLRGSFRPAEAITALRGYVRHRDTLVAEMSTTIQRMQKALVQMNVLLPQVITDITGTTGLAILHDIVDGRTDPQQLVLHRDPRCHSSPEDFVAALTGNYRPEHVFALKQNLALFEYYQGMLAECDAAIERHLQTLAAKTEPPASNPPPRRTKAQPRSKEPRFDIRGYLYRLTGTDLSQIDGIGPYQALRLISEIGTDMGLAERAPLHRLAHPRTAEQDLRRTPPEFPHARLREPRRRDASNGRDEPGANTDRVGSLLPAPRRAHRKSQGDHRYGSEGRHPRLSDAQGRNPIPGPWSRCL